MDEPSDGRRPTIEMPQIQQLLTECVEIAMSNVRHLSGDRFLQLQATQTAVRILCDIVNCIEVRDIQAAQRHSEAAWGRLPRHDGQGTGW